MKATIVDQNYDRKLFIALLLADSAIVNDTAAGAHTGALSL